MSNEPKLNPLPGGDRVTVIGKAKAVSMNEKRVKNIMETCQKAMTDEFPDQNIRLGFPTMSHPVKGKTGVLIFSVCIDLPELAS